MDALAAYQSGSDSDSDEKTATKTTAETTEEAPVVPPVAFKSFAVVSAPSVQLDRRHVKRFTDPNSKELMHNPKAEEMWKPLAGPFNPWKNTLGQSQGASQNGVTGFYEKTHIENFAFDEQHNTFLQLGYAADPSQALQGGKHSGGPGTMVGDKQNIKKFGGETFSILPNSKMSSEQKTLRKKRQKLTGDAADVDNYQGPWASYLWEEKEAPQQATEEQKEFAQSILDKRRRQRREEVVETDWETSEFHGNELYDYQGRSYVAKPSGLKVQEGHTCYIPKKCIHTWSGHKKGVARIQFFPGTGHLLLSASMDKTLKIWEVGGKKKCLRTFTGHREAVRDVDFSYDGKRFISASYDTYIKYWDTETGQCISKHSSKKIPYCVKFNPDPDKNHEFLVGQADKYVMQWDTRSNEIVQQYDEHLGPVNSITFIDQNRRFVSTSDDKKVFIWEYGIPVVIKHIAEPDMHSMPFVALHPNKKVWVGQSQDNRILCYGAMNRTKVNTKKQYSGHLCAGYAPQIDFSPDGRYMCSGDAEGRVFFWDWRTSRVYRTLKAHSQVTIGCIWHPIEPSKVATCSWDGLIKYWD